MEEMLKSVAGAGAAAVITVTFIHPIDVLKTRLQVSGGPGARDYKSLGIGGSLAVIAREEGVGAFWKGVGAAWMREASYTSLRLGLYGPIKTAMGIKKDSGFFMKFVAGGLAGALGSTVGNPFDVVKTRMMAKEGKVTPSLGGTFAELYRAQGMAGFYRGLEANVMRAVVLNGTKMACYDQIKGELVKANLAPPKGVLTDFMAAFGAGFFMTCTVAPFDKIRTRLMNQPPDAKLYTGFLDCGIKIIRAEGPGGLWAGFLPIWARFAPTTSTQLVIFGIIKEHFNIQGGGDVRAPEPIGGPVVPPPSSSSLRAPSARAPPFPSLPHPTPARTRPHTLPGAVNAPPLVAIIFLARLSSPAGAGKGRRQSTATYIS